MGHYTVLEEIAVADCALDAVGRDLSDLFETVARAVAEIMVDPATIAVTVQREISLAASALDLLLFDWIAELVFLKDSEQLIITDTTVRVTGSPAYRLTAHLTGGRIDRSRTILRADVKAPTLHLLTVEPVADGWQARIVLDI